jgi:Tol biopolymer transport system component
MRSRLSAIVFLALAVAFLPAAEDEKLKPVNLPINTDKDEDDPAPSSSNLTLLYSSNASGKKEVFATQRKKATDAWTAGKAVPELTSKRADFTSPFMTADGRYPQFLYFATNADPENLDKKGDNYDLYFLIKQTAKSDWTTLTAMVTTGSEKDELHPWLTADGQTLYFSRLDKDGWQVYATSRPPEGGQFGPPVKLDLPTGFHHATVSSDGKTMFLQGPLEEKDGKPRWGLFRSKAAGKGWGKPEPLTALNSSEAPTGDRSPALSRDDATLYFVSDRPGGKGGLDIWSIPTAQVNKKK